MDKNRRTNEHLAEGSNVIVDKNAPAPTDMLSEFIEGTMENIQHLFDHEKSQEKK